VIGQAHFHKTGTVLADSILKLLRNQSMVGPAAIRFFVRNKRWTRVIFRGEQQSVATPQARERTGSPTLQTIQDPILDLAASLGLLSRWRLSKPLASMRNLSLYT